MGDIADEHIDRMMDLGWGYRLPKTPKKPVCSICHAKTVHWRLFDGEYKLADDQRQHPGNRYVQHTCPTSADGFGDCDA